MSIEVVRIDDRLIHGQVATTWINDYEIEQVIIVDDEVNQDEMRKTMVGVAAPVGVKVRIFSTARFLEVMQKAKITRKTLLIMTTPITALELLENNFPIKEIIVGGMHMIEGRERISKAVSINEKEKDAFKKIAEYGTKLTVQTVPRDEKSDLLSLLQ
ncbi:MAG: PTS sugar transporter subunit IIB [Lactobacillus sp.]|jgi:fructose PTS system EIIB component|uniref:PTS mannose/fructose/sorbose transporter subunit IIB n=1 Tax=Bombilactobacillus bombi TaxID=1303590 RepID=A0A3R7CQN5_9LACO|nr:PTS sugar transporter subunit IIB [Bombilactobacillus bombi]MCO6543640.1 PTS sugar transporter subunit IIB [Lactobacillus sp.]RHW52235.1 PTS mannose/fructose/sorbose transporter subunit IIB [Bombilactobacillus bombi]